jgi:hypothetical protein
MSETKCNQDGSTCWEFKDLIKRFGYLRQERDALLQQQMMDTECIERIRSAGERDAARVEVLEKALRSVMEVSGPGFRSHGVAKRALASTTEAAESEEDSTEITAPFGMAKIANVMGEYLLDKEDAEDCSLHRCNKCDKDCDI